MLVKKIDTLVVGAGQAGLAMSEHLSRYGIEHILLERNRIAESWRTERWDSLVANGPAWHDRFPTMEFANLDPDAFATKEEVTDYFTAFARQIKAPVHCNVEVKRVQSLKGRRGFKVETSAGVVEALRVVAATGAFQHPVIPPVIPEQPAITQIHSSSYRNPEQLASGAVMVIGAGSSGSQIADELSRAGKQVYLSVGPHDRPPRSYRGRDFVWWLGVLGKWDTAALSPGTEHVTIAVSGAYGGNTMDFRRLGAQGITLVGRTESCQNGVLTFAPNLAQTIANGDNYYLRLLDEADAYIEANGLALPEEPDARTFVPNPECITHPISELNLSAAGINTIIWATGFSSDYSWLPENALDNEGKPQHQRGVSTESGIYFLGLPWQSRRGSSFIWGVWHDAKFLADQIEIQRSYAQYQTSAENEK